MVTIESYQSLSNSDMNEHRCLKKKRLYKTAKKCNDQQQHKAIIESEKVSTN